MAAIHELEVERQRDRQLAATQRDRAAIPHRQRDLASALATTTRLSGAELRAVTVVGSLSAYMPAYPSVRA